MALHYKSCGLTNIWLKSGYKAHETKYGTSYSYEDIDGLYRAIAVQLCADQRKIEPDVLRFLRKRLGYSQGELGAELGYTSQAVAKWEKGTSNIPVAVARLVCLLCLNKFFPGKTLRDAFKSKDTLPVDRLEFEYTNSTWKAVGTGVAVSDVQISNLTYLDLTKFVRNNSVYLPKNYPPPFLDEKQTPLKRAIFSANDILQWRPYSTVLEGTCVADAAIPAQYETQKTDTTSKTKFTPATTLGNFKLELDSITHGTC